MFTPRLFRRAYYTLFTCLQAVLTSSVIDAPPGIHCSTNEFASGQLTLDQINGGRIVNLENAVYKASLKLGQTICMRVEFDPPKNSSNNVNSTPKVKAERVPVLFTVTYKSLTQQAEISETYKFAFPLLTSTCVCDCQGGKNFCGPNKFDATCQPRQKGGSCYPVASDFVRNNDCPQKMLIGSACCNITVSPLNNSRFLAFKVDHVYHFGLFDVAYYVYTDNRWQRQKSYTDVPIRSFRGGQLPTIGKGSMKLNLLGRMPSEHMLPKGMMYVDVDKPDVVKCDTYINRAAGPSFLNWLGWYRETKEHSDVYHVTSGGVKFGDKVKVEMLSCKEHRHIISLPDAFNYAIDHNGQISSVVHWGRSVVEHSAGEISNCGLQNRTLVAVMRASRPMSIQIQLNSSFRLALYEHVSKLQRFSGQIRVDKHSHRFANISFVGATGTLIGYMYEDEEKTKMDMAFSTYVPGSKPDTPQNFVTQIVLPSRIVGKRYVCFRPSNRIDNSSEECHWFPYNETKMEWFISPNPAWAAGKPGDCPGCNDASEFESSRMQRGFFDSLFGKSFDLDKLFRGAMTSPEELVATVVKLILLLISLLLLLWVTRRCIYPLARSAICPDSCGLENCLIPRKTVNDRCKC